MEKETQQETILNEIIQVIQSNLSAEEKHDILSDYHDNDIAKAINDLDYNDRQQLYDVFGIEHFSEILSYLDDISEFLEEVPVEVAANFLENMDADDAVDAIENIKSETMKLELLTLMESEASKDVTLIQSYEEDTIGSMMTTNYILIQNNLTIKEAMKQVIQQAKENDNVSTIYVENQNKQYCGAIDLRDLIIAREYTDIESVIQKNYPHLNVLDKIQDCIEDIKNYSEDSLPVLNANHEVVGILTSQDLVEAIDEEMTEDYAKLAAISAEEHEESVLVGAKNRLPWLVLLLFLGLGVSGVVGMFESIVMELTIIMSFQSLILDMAGNAGTQSLATTIRLLVDTGVTGKEKINFIWREVKIGGLNGFLLGTLSCVFIAGYLCFLKGYLWLDAVQISACVGTALFIAMLVSGLVGALTPILFDKINVDPAVASGPLITTINDLVAVITYYGLAAIFLIGKF